MAIMARPKSSETIIDCRSTPRASSWRPAPTSCAIWTLKPMETQKHMPLMSQTLVLTRPTEADATGPRLPTMPASM